MFKLKNNVLHLKGVSTELQFNTDNAFNELCINESIKEQNKYLESNFKSTKLIKHNIEHINDEMVKIKFKLYSKKYDNNYIVEKTIIKNNNAFFTV